MSDCANLGPAYHVLLIGIDSYAEKPLYGCVNDIDAVQRLLLGPRVGIPKESIKRLASYHAGALHETTIPDVPATLANLRTALAELGSEMVSPGDRVFVYYSGHGARAPVTTADGRVFYRESLAPVDFNAEPSGWQLLFDFEINRLLAAITMRTRAVTVVLDCCHSAGATRELPLRSNMISRFLDLRGRPRRAEPLSISTQMTQMAAEGVRGVATSVDDCQVVAACLNHELAQEAPGCDGVQHGLLTRALVSELGNLPDIDLRPVPWGRIWQRMRVSVEMENPWQHLWMVGNTARAVIAGPPIEGDIGIPVTRTSFNSYRIDAGTLASVTTGASVAVYGDKPPAFPPVGSEEDHKVRLSTVLLKVTKANRSTALAQAEGTPFELPPGARGRLVKLGGPARLRCSVAPRNDAIAASLAKSSLLEVVDELSAQVRLERTDDDSWAITDDIHGAKPDYPVLYRLPSNQLGLARAVLEHYFYYALPLRMATLCTDLSGALQLALLACPKDRDLTPAEAQEAKLPEVSTEGEFPYDLAPGDKVCIRIHNTSSERLRVTLLNCAASGKVQFLGDQVIDARSLYVFWANNVLGAPFEMTLSAGATQAIDRIVAVGTTAFNKDLSYLRLDTAFADIVSYTRRRSKDFNDGTTSNLPAEQWTATQTVVRTSTRLVTPTAADIGA